MYWKMRERRKIVERRKKITIRREHIEGVIGKLRETSIRVYCEHETFHFDIAFTSTHGRKKHEKLSKSSFPTTRLPQKKGQIIQQHSVVFASA